MALSKATEYLFTKQPYIKPEEEENVRNHKHNAQVDGLYFKYVQNPMANYFVEFLPTWLAPNLVTLIGFQFCLLANVVMVTKYGNAMDGPIDGWFAVLLGVCYWSYMLFDNMDGKQARRTGSGSPMGAFFDHGLDALTSLIVIYPLARILNIGGGVNLLMFLMMSTTAFYYLTLQEYYMGYLHLPALSGPDDTSLLFSLACYFTAYIGSDTYMAEYDFGFGDLRLGFFLARFAFCYEMFFILPDFARNLWAAKDSEHFVKRYKGTGTFITHVSFGVLLGAVWAVYNLAGSTMMDDYPKLTTMAYGAQFLQGTLLTMVSSFTHATHNPYRFNILFSWSLMGINLISFLGTGKPVINDYMLVSFVCALSWACLAWYVYFVLQDFMRILDVYTFTIKQKKVKPEGNPSKKEKTKSPKNKKT